MKIRGLGYIGFHATDLAPWRSFAEELLGFMPAGAPAGMASGSGPQDTLFYRLDERSWRVAVHQSPKPGLAYIGWELADRTAFADAAEHLERCGVAIERSGPGARGAAAVRGVSDLVAFADPDGNRHELFYGAPTSLHDRFVSPAGVSGFVTANGMGHVLFVVRDARAAEDYYTRVLGLRTTDRMDMGAGKRAIFMRANDRHHSVAVTDVIPEPMFHHVMFEAERLEDVGRAWERLGRSTTPIMMTLGQHANDPMLSFYATSPSGCGVEFGCGGTLVDDASWAVREVGPEELWGHRGPTMDAIEAGGGRS
jgi:3,4-dihydroxy-9,10-secoandrosta-1,3,5(10)-triene-9,17-dione 4,5-dioxygenase